MRESLQEQMFQEEEAKNEERMLPFCRIQFVESYTSDNN